MTHTGFVKNAFKPKQPSKKRKNVRNYPAEITGQPATPPPPANPFTVAVNAFNNFVTGVGNLFNPPPAQHHPNPVMHFINTGIKAVNSVIHTFNEVGKSLPPQTPPVDDGNNLSGNSAPPPPIQLPDIGEIVDDFGETVSGMAAHPLAVLEAAGDYVETVVHEIGTGKRHLSEAEADQIQLLMANETDPMAIDVLLSIQRNGIPREEVFSDYMSQFAHFGWDEQSDFHAQELMNIIMADRANDPFESAVAFDPETGYVVLDRIGGRNSVGLQEEDIEQMQGRNVILVHNHPASLRASEEDKQVAFDAGAQSLVIVTPEGFEYIYRRGESAMQFEGVNSPSYTIAPPTPEEYLELLGQSGTQAFENMFNPVEAVMYQGEDVWETYPGGINSYEQMCQEVFVNAQNQQAARIVGFPCFEDSEIMDEDFRGDRDKVNAAFRGLLSGTATALDSFNILNGLMNGAFSLNGVTEFPVLPAVIEHYLGGTGTDLFMDPTLFDGQPEMESALSEQFWTNVFNSEFSPRNIVASGWTPSKPLTESYPTNKAG